MNQKNKKGFTLIELLVVIAIIGILSGVILVNVGGESEKASNARIKSAMSQVRLAMESDRSEDTVFAYADPDTVASALKTDITSTKSGGTLFFGENSANAWCAEVKLKGDNGFWCVDSTGYSGTTAECEATKYDCKAP